MAQLHQLPFAGQNEIFSIYGWRDLSGNGRMDDRHAGWDIRPPKVSGAVPTAAAQAPCAGRVDWLQQFNRVTRANDATSYGNCIRLLAEGKEPMYIYMAHLCTHALERGQRVERGTVAGRYGPHTTGNSGGIHCHLEYRVGGLPVGHRVCPGELLGIANTKDVTYDREQMSACAIGQLNCTVNDYRWRLGAGTDHELYLDANNHATAKCHAGVLYRVYATAMAADQLWCQITPPPRCIVKGHAPACWVSAACGSYTAASITAEPKHAADEEHKQHPGSLERCCVTPGSRGNALELAALAYDLGLNTQYMVSGGDATALRTLALNGGGSYESRPD